MKYFTILAALAASAAAIPTFPNFFLFPNLGTGNSASGQSSSGSSSYVQANPVDIYGCVSQTTANNIVSQFSQILQHDNIQQANQTAQRLLGDNFSENSGSINSLAGIPLDQITFQGKQAYINGLLGAQGPHGIETNYVYVGNCNNVVWKWIFHNVGTGAYQVSGINIFHINRQGQIANQDVEFNSVAWGEDTGFTVTAPSS